MARPTKQGVDYFSLDVNMDSKVRFIEVRFGLEGFAILIKLLQQIYSFGYWYPFNNDEKMLFAYDINVDINLINDIINEAITRDLFDKDLYEKYEILTSKGIQKRYQDIVKRRKDVEVVKEYLLINGDFGVNANIIEVNVNINQENAYKSTQSKVKETKVKESKVNNIVSKDTMSVETDSKLELHFVDFENIFDYWNKHSLLATIKQLTPKRKTHLNARFKEHGLEAIYQVIQNCHNSKFMRGQNSKGWTASFDWVFGSPNNFIKVLEGNYLDKTNNKEQNIYQATLENLGALK